MSPRAFSEFGMPGREAFWRLVDRGYVEFTKDQKLALTQHYWNEA